MLAIGHAQRTDLRVAVLLVDAAGGVAVAAVKSFGFPFGLLFGFLGHCSPPIAFFASTETYHDPSTGCRGAEVCRRSWRLQADQNSAKSGRVSETCITEDEPA